MRVLITGSCGLIGSEAVLYYNDRASQVVGIDNNMRREFFGSDGDTT
jgi:CDP-paratose 2-epimerase